MESRAFIDKHTIRRLAIFLIILSYGSAGLFYWRWRGIPRTVQENVCPLCPNIDGSGSDLQKFISRTVVIGTINAALLFVGLILFVGLPRIWFRLYEKLRK